MTKLRIYLYKAVFFKNSALFFLLCFACLQACQSEQQTHSATTSAASATPTGTSDPKALDIIEASIKAHGGNLYAQSTINFDFRDRHYVYHQDGGTFQYERIFEDSSSRQVRDILTNDAFVREIEGQETDLSEEWKKKYSNSVNSVMYFLMLPFKLRDPAVNANYVGETTLKGEAYNQIRVTFGKENGGKDYKDIFMFWFHQEKKTLDYLAYSYETDGGGVRFRESFNRQTIQGIVFQDYNNYKADFEEPLEGLGLLFEAGKLKKLSEIVNENIQVDVHTTENTESKP